MSVLASGPPSDPFISPKYRASDWKKLAMTPSDTSDWQTAVEIFADRLNGRYMDQVEALREHVKPAIKEWSGFAILAIDCLVIETLGQFYCGYEETPGNNMNFYVDYMSKISTLSQPNAFDTNTKQKLFYQHFRCGILHQAQTKKKSLVLFNEPVMVVFADDKNPDQGLIVDRNKLHDALVAELDAYMKLLLDGSDSQKRDNFIKKMDFIAS